jgi:sulfotransferase
MQKLFFLSGLPRTGTTVLGNILNQNPDIHVSSTSGLLEFLYHVNEVYLNITDRYIDVDPKQFINVSDSIVKSWYKHVDKKYIIDKWRGWMNNLPQIVEVINNNPKIICTYRPVEEVLVSFIDLLDKDRNNFIDSELTKRNLEITNINRSLFLLNEGVVGETIEFISNTFHKYGDKILYISYDDIVTDTENTLKKIETYLEIGHYENYSLTDIDTSVNDNDFYWGIKELHNIRPVVGKKSKDPKEYFDSDFLQYLQSINSKIQFLF